MGLYFQKLCLDNLSEGSYLVVSNVMEGTANAVTFGYNVERQNVQIESNRTLPVSDTHTLDLTIIDDKVSASQALLTEWANSQALFNFRAYGYGGDTFLSWNTAVPLTLPRQYDTIMTRRVLMTLAAVPGYTGTQPNVSLPVYAGPNLLSVYKHWEGSSTLLNGFTQEGTGTFAQSAGTQTVTQGASADAAAVSQLMVFPFDGVRLTASVTGVSKTGGNWFIELRYYDPSGTLITSDIQSYPTASGNRNFISATTPTGTYSVQLAVVAPTTNGNTIVFRNPAIRLGYETSYAN